MMICLMLLFVFHIASTMPGPMPGMRFNAFVTSILKSVYADAVRRPDRYDDIPPTFSVIDISLSFKTIIKFDFRLAALFSASYAMPPVSAPSPMIETTE